MDEKIEKIYKIENCIYNLYNLLINSNNKEDYNKYKDLLEGAIETENKIFEEFKNNLTFLELLYDLFSSKIDIEALNDTLPVETPYCYKKEELFDFRIYYKIIKIMNMYSKDVQTLKQYEKLEKDDNETEYYVEIPQFGKINLRDIGIDEEYINRNNGVDLRIFNDVIHIDKDEIIEVIYEDLEDIDDYTLLKEGVALKNELYLFSDDANPSLANLYFLRGSAEIILKYLKNKKSLDYEYIIKLMFNNEFLEQILLQTNFDIDKSIEILEKTKRKEDKFYNYVLKQLTSYEMDVIQVLCQATSPMYDLFAPYLKTILEYKTEEELEEINSNFNEKIEVLNMEGYHYVKEIFKGLKKQSSYRL